MKKNIKYSGVDDTVTQKAEFCSTNGLAVGKAIEDSALYDAIPSGLLVLGLNCKIKLVNLAGASMLGTEPSFLIGRNFRQFITKEASSTFTKFFQEIFSSKTRQNCKIKMASQAAKFLFIHFEGLVSDDGQSCILSLIDVSEYEQIENSLKVSESLSREINATKDKFFSIIAHDLRNPFNSIVGFSNLLAGQVKERNFEDLENYVTVIQQSSERAMDLLSNLLEWSRSQTGQLNIRPVHMDLASLVKEVVYSLHDTTVQKSISIITELEDHVLILADRAMISTVLRNLISNAVKFSYPDTKIVISAKRLGKESLVTVQDSGVGIRKSDLDKIFRLDKSFTKTGTANEKGTGLGLLLCKEFITKHGGNIWVESEFGKGSTFSFTIPH